ncbi:hypothetical protein PVAND_014927 [Polypedilum vanderplanki]|uniref:Uncharacterized protein n=1 Tax=Polypedilum vanderplanki TaxID=319348 RepID=A0A9J6BB52_POLVA|nr:hypothetical protein PVAND_014927 [Polypedilum vanderplanki]
MLDITLKPELSLLSAAAVGSTIIPPSSTSSASSSSSSSVHLLGLAGAMASPSNGAQASPQTPTYRKKKCIRYKESAEEAAQRNELDHSQSDDNLGSCGSVDDAHTPDDDTESLNQSMSSPGGLSGLSSLQSPSTSLASPINLLASPSTPHPVHHHEENGLVASLVNQLNRSKWDASKSNNGVNKNGGNGLLNDDKTKQGSNDVQIKTEPMDQSNNMQQQQQQLQQQHLHLQQQHRLDPFFYDKLPIIRNPVGANPRDVNNPLSVNQLTKRDFPAHTGGYYAHPFQKPLMAHPLAHPHHLAQFHAANFANFQLAAAAAVQQNANAQKDNATSNGASHHRDDGNAISVT